MFPVGQEFRSNLAWWFCLVISYEFIVTCWPCLQSSEGLTGAASSVPTWPTVMADKLVLALGGWL